MTNDLKKHLSNILNENITEFSSVRGGDISKTYKIETFKDSYFLKLNSDPSAIKMFQAEAYGLECIRKTSTVKTPKVLACGTFENYAYLVMDFIESKPPSVSDFEALGLQLAQLHKNTSKQFGLDQDNFIGNLPQSNSSRKTWIEFYVQKRLLPQLDLAKQKQMLSDRECPNENRIKQILDSLFNNVKPSLIHGDLWSGNYLISKDGVPYLIDPAIYYGHSEVDIAMSKLFGAFGNSFYEAYGSTLSFDEQTKIRIEIYQLYYLLVHLNLFGSTYYNSVKSILSKFF